MTTALKQYVFEHKGAMFCARIFADETHGAPWTEHDGHGPVEQVRRSRGSQITKRPGQRVLHSKGYTTWLYDWSAACKLARKDGWNAEPYDAPNPVERAVQADFDRMQGWLKERWHWIGIGVHRADGHGESSLDDADYYGSALWGIESDSSEDYLQQVMRELADDCIPTPSPEVDLWPAEPSA